MTGTVTHPARDKRMLVVFSGPRAGSNLLVDILGQLPDVLALSEVFNPAGIYGLSLHPDLETELTERAGGPRALARLFRMDPPGALALFPPFREPTSLARLSPVRLTFEHYGKISHFGFSKASVQHFEQSFIKLLSIFNGKSTIKRSVDCLSNIIFICISANS